MRPRDPLIALALAVSLAASPGGASTESGDLATRFDALRIPADALPPTCSPKPAGQSGPFLPMPAGNALVTSDPQLVAFLASFFGPGTIPPATVRAAYAAGYSERVPAREIGIYALELTAPLPAEQRRAFLAARGSPTTTRFLHGDTLAVLLWRDHPEDTLCFDAIAAHLGRVSGGRP